MPGLLQRLSPGGPILRRGGLPQLAFPHGEQPLPAAHERGASPGAGRNTRQSPSGEAEACSRTGPGGGAALRRTSVTSTVLLAEISRELAEIRRQLGRRVPANDL